MILLTIFWYSAGWNASRYIKNTSKYKVGIGIGNVHKTERLTPMNYNSQV